MDAMNEQPVLGEEYEEGIEAPDLDEQLDRLHIESGGHGESPAHLLKEPNPLNTSQPQSTLSKKTALLKTALGEVKHFAGGLIAHPYEATKHYTVLRHSHGLVYYSGPTTSVAITVFSDQALPADRKLWLQKRGYSGRTGLKIGATLGSRSAWIDVTPEFEALPENLPPADNRAWQRDISKFLKKAKDAKNLRHHRPYETDIVRIPHVADEGYFRIVLCAGRKVLCPSPVFRYVTTTISPGMVRGASLSTLPVELGVKLGAFVARNAANTAAHGALSPVTTAYQNNVQPVVNRYNPLGLTQMAAQTAYDESGAAERVSRGVQQIGEQYEERQDKSTRLITDDAAVGGVERQEKVGNDVDGPRPPFPIRISGTISRDSIQMDKDLDIPTATVGNISRDVLNRLAGVYVAWLALPQSKPSPPSSSPPGDDSYIDKWHPCLLSCTLVNIITRGQRETASVIPQRIMTIHTLANDSLPTMFPTSVDNARTISPTDATSKSKPKFKATILLMSFLRPITPSLTRSRTSTTQIIDAKAQPEASQPPKPSPLPTTTTTTTPLTTTDISLATTLLSNPSYSPHQTLTLIRTTSSNRTLSQRVVDVGQTGQRQFDRYVPMHRLGIKADKMGMGDRGLGRGGFRVPR